MTQINIKNTTYCQRQWRIFRNNIIFQRLVLILALWGVGFNLGLPLAAGGTRQEFVSLVCALLVTVFALGVHLGYTFRYPPHGGEVPASIAPFIEIITPLLGIVGGIGMAEMLIFISALVPAFGWGRVRPYFSNDLTMCAVSLFASTVWLTQGWARMEGRKIGVIWPYTVKKVDRN